MTDSYSDPQQQGAQGEGRREGQRGRSNRGGNRDAGGFRIRLSDNEMSAAKALQDAFNLRSPVAVLGFAVRTLGQMLADGKLTELMNNNKAKPPAAVDATPATAVPTTTEAAVVQSQTLSLVPASPRQSQKQRLK